MIDFQQYLRDLERELQTGNATEHSHRPALKTLLESIGPGITATNEPKRIACGAPDFIVTQRSVPLGYVEAKDVGKSLSAALKTDQLRRYLDSLDNLILTDYLEFRWFLRSEHRKTVRLADESGNGKLRVRRDAQEDLTELLQAFLHAQAPTVKTPKELAERMAALARLIRESIDKAFAREGERGTLHSQLEGFREVLIHTLTLAQFADMYAQTICYGLFAARVNKPDDGQRFTREHAAYDLPRSNPFLQRLFAQIAGPGLDDSIAWAVDDLAELLNRSDMDAILRDFGKRTRQEDPVVHFYETFLAAYDPKMRATRGVYYTPEPVVSYIVRSVDYLLKKDFGLKDGLADASTTTIKVQQPNKKTPKDVAMHRVQILDPATGTGTFLFSVIDLIRERFEGNEGMWNGYVSRHLLPRLYGFEFLMAPYTIAHMKLDLQLEQSGYNFASDERLKVYLTNTLEEAHEYTGLPLFTQWLADEANAAAQIKTKAPVMVVLGNPPYSGHSANKSPWIHDLMRGKDRLNDRSTENYFEMDGKPLGETQVKWLNDDYVKFIRFAQWRIEQTGYGILGFITNHGYLDNPTFRGMRESLMKGFDDIYLLDLHGNTKKKEKAPDGLPDENVFDIQQGVAIGIFVKKGDNQKRKTCVYHAELWGKREEKYGWLWQHDVSDTAWEEIEPRSSFQLFIPRDSDLQSEYNVGFKLTDIFPDNNVGFVTARDRFAIAFNKETLLHRIEDFRAAEETLPTHELKHKYGLKDTSSWGLAEARNGVRADKNWEAHFTTCL